MSAVSQLDRKVIVVTGACGLIGRRLVPGLVALGARVVVADLSLAACEDVAAAVVGARPVAVDVTERTSVERLWDATVDEFGGVDGIVHAAAIDDKVATVGARLDAPGFAHFDVETFRRTLDVNVTGTFTTSQVFGALMAEQRSGSIVNVASTYAVVAPAPSLYVDPDGTRVHHKSPAYVASKGAVLAFTRYLAAELGAFGVRANTLTPGGVRANQPAWFVEAYARRTPLGRMASTDDLVGAVAFLLSDASAYVTGTNLVVDGGFSAW